VPAPVKPRKLIRLYTRGWNEIDEVVERDFEDAVLELRDAGVEVVGKHDDPAIAAFEDALERDVDGALDIVAYELRWPFEEYIARFGDAIGKRLHSLVDRAHEMKPADYVALLDRRRATQEHCRKLAADVGADAYITLASSGPAIEGFTYSGSRAFLVYASWLGFPAFALPLLQAHELPFGVQLMGLGNQDGRLCAVANWVTRLFD
jgi:Asp-tRNA(Asn)/Glu-tRNA(Gln) amidotransferase A subunit family amidase